MIDDLKADSARWEAERRQQAVRNTQGGTFASRDAAAPSLSRRSNSPTAGYRQSETHSARQHYGPTDPAGYPDVGRDSYDNAPRYPGSQAPGYSGNSQSYSGSAAPAIYSQQAPSPYSTSAGYSYPSGSSFSPQPDPRDPRYSGTPSHPQGFGGEPYTAVNANMAASRSSDYYSSSGQPARIATTMAPAQGQTYITSGSQAQAGYPSGGYYPPSSQTPYGSAPVTQDPLYGRGAYQFS